MLAIGAHPDDVEFGCGATLAKWADAGSVVHLLVLTDGSKGSWDPQVDSMELAETRSHEQQRAAEALGIAAVHSLALVDGELVAGPVEQAAVCRVIRETRPTVILGHDPWHRYRLHPDHEVAGRLTISGIVAARDPHFFREQGLKTHRPETLLLFEAEVVDHRESIGDWNDRKLAALACHESQWRSTMGIVAGSAEFDEQRARFEASLRRDVEEFKRIDEL